MRLVEQGLQFEEQGKYEEAIKAFEEAITIAPACEEAYWEMALLYDDNLNDISNAVAAYEQFIRVTRSAAQRTRAQQWMFEAQSRMIDTSRPAPTAATAVAAAHAGDAGLPATPREWSAAAVVATNNIEELHAREEALLLACLQHDDQPAAPDTTALPPPPPLHQRLAQQAETISNLQQHVAALQQQLMAQRAQSLNVITAAPMTARAGQLTRDYARLQGQYAVLQRKLALEIERRQRADQIITALYRLRRRP